MTWKDWAKTKGSAVVMGMLIALGVILMLVIWTALFPNARSWK